MAYVFTSASSQSNVSLGILASEFSVKKEIFINLSKEAAACEEGDKPFTSLDLRDGSPLVSQQAMPPFRHLLCPSRMSSVLVIGSSTVRFTRGLETC